MRMNLDGFRMLVQDNDVALDYFREKECARRTVPLCSLCQRTMSWIKSTDMAGVGRWRCPTHKGQKMSPLLGSFSNSILAMTKHLQLIWCWSLKMAVHTMMAITSIAEKVVIMLLVYRIFLLFFKYYGKHCRQKSRIWLSAKSRLWQP